MRFNFMKGNIKFESQDSAQFSIKSILSHPIHGIKAAVDWFKAGEVPPETHKTSMRIMTALLIFGFSFLTIMILCASGICFESYNISYPSYFFMTFITLCPGLYALWITICCWRRIEGYEWGMIPFFD